MKSLLQKSFKSTSKQCIDETQNLNDTNSEIFPRSNALNEIVATNVSVPCVNNCYRTDT